MFMVLEVGISTNSLSARTAALEALAELAPPGQAFAIKLDEYSDSSFILSGDNEDHLTTLIMRLKQEADIQVEVGPPQVAYAKLLAHEFCNATFSALYQFPLLFRRPLLCDGVVHIAIF